METKGTMWSCDHPHCKAQIFLEDGENIQDMEWVRIPGEGLFCPECAPAVLERVRDDRAGKDAAWEEYYSNSVNDIMGVED